MIPVRPFSPPICRRVIKVNSTGTLGVLMKCVLRNLLVGLIATVLTIEANGSGASTSHPARDPHTLRVMTYNIHAGRGTDGKLDLHRLAKIIREADVDVVAIQEVDRDTKRS